MATFTGTGGADGASAATGGIQGFSGGTAAELQDALGDTFNGLGGNDQVLAGSGNDTLNGGAGDDGMAGGAGDDTFNPGSVFIDEFGVGADFMYGGAGNDTFNAGSSGNWRYIVGYYFDDAPDGITVNLKTGKATDGFGNTDTFKGGIDFVIASFKNDTLIGSSGDDVLAPGAGTDTVDGGAGIDQIAYYFIDKLDGDAFGFKKGITVNHTGDNEGTVLDPTGKTDTFVNVEIITATRFKDTLNGSNFADAFIGGEGADAINGKGGSDTVIYTSEVIGGGFDGVDINLASSKGVDPYGDTDKLTSIENIIGTQFADVIGGSSSDNRLEGGDGKDKIKGLGGEDRLLGGADADVLTGGSGRDTLSGGADKDIFDYNARSETGITATTRDKITDFTHLSDRIDLRGIDADTTASGNQEFSFIRTAGFHHEAGELRYVKGSVTLVSGDVDGDGKADFVIELTGNKTLTAADFLL